MGLFTSCKFLLAHDAAGLCSITFRRSWCLSLHAHTNIRDVVRSYQCYLADGGSPLELEWTSHILWLMTNFLIKSS